jgi:hypothetical protein
MSLEVALNLVLAGLLAAVIVYAMRLHKRLGTWREGKAELDKAAAEFTKAAKRAEAAIDELKAASEASGRLLEDQTRKALSLKDDLEMLVHRAEPVADRLVDRVRLRPAPAEPVSAPTAPAAPASVPVATAQRVPARIAPSAAREADDQMPERGPVRSMAEQELLRAIAERRKGAANAQVGARGA